MILFKKDLDDSLIFGEQPHSKPGKLVLSKSTSSEINVDDLQSGIYIVKIVDEQNEIVRKFINKETNKLLFIFTKKLIPFVNTSSSIFNKKDIFSWINSIEPSERKIRSFSYLVTN